MSTLKTTNLQNASASSPAIVLAADGSATANLSSVNGGPIAGSRNRIINGDMRIDQRNAGASVTPTADGVTFSVDRWKARLSQSSKYSAQRNSSIVPSGFTHSLAITSLSAYSVTASDYFAVEHLVEGFNMSDLGWGTASAKSVTVSFWARSSLTGTFGGSVTNGSPFDRSYPFTYTISAANTWEYKTVSISGPTTGGWNIDNTIGLSVFIGLGAGSSFSGTAGSWANSTLLSATGATSVVGTSGATFYITGVQLEPGTVATPFERRSYGQELLLCQRYFETNYPVGSAINTNSGLNGSWISISVNGNDFYDAGRLTFMVPKRADATVIVYNSIQGGGSFYDVNISSANGNTAVRWSGQYGVSLYASTTFTGNHIYSVRYTASAEL